MKMNNRFIYGILSIVLAAAIAFIAIPAVTSKTSTICYNNPPGTELQVIA